MPTAAKIVGAICFAIFGYFAAVAVKPVMPEGTQFGWFLEISAFIGLLNGWFVMGRLTGGGVRAGIGSGMRTSITVVVWALLFFSIYEMVKRSTKMRYDGPMEAVTAAFGLMLDYGRLLLTPEIIATVLIGGAIGGAVTEWAGKRWN